MPKTYAEIYRAWKDDHKAHWAEAARAIDWFTEPVKIFDGAQGVYGRWFPDAVGNTCHNCVDRHVAAGARRPGRR
jgi:propionyl-CoA synthetase